MGRAPSDRFGSINLACFPSHARMQGYGNFRGAFNPELSLHYNEASANGVETARNLEMYVDTIGRMIFGGSNRCSELGPNTEPEGRVITEKESWVWAEGAKQTCLYHAALLGYTQTAGPKEGELGHPSVSESSRAPNFISSRNDWAKESRGPVSGSSRYFPVA